MRDTDFYSQILGIEKPWFVEHVDLDVEGQRVDIWLKHDEKVKWPCPTCKKELVCRDHAEEREWRHLDTCQFKTVLHARIPRVECPEHDVVQVAVPWSEPRSRFTLLFERFAIDVLLGARTISKACEILRITWDPLRLIMDRAVDRGLSRRDLEGLTYVGIDEKSFAKGHRYMSILTDIKGSRVLEVVEGRDQTAADTLWQSLPEEQRISIKAVAMDMWEAYELSAKAYVGQAAIVHDKFHIAQYLGKAVDMVRKKEHRTLTEAGNEVLKKTKYLWLKNPSNWSEKDEKRFDEIKADHLQVGKAWAIKEAFQDFWDYTYQGCAKNFFHRWYFWATHSRLKPVIDVAKMLKRHLGNILTYFKHRITNAVSEGFNSKIQMIKYSARGFRNPESYRTAILFYCGKLNLYPC